MRRVPTSGTYQAYIDAYFVYYKHTCAHYLHTHLHLALDALHALHERTYTCIRTMREEDLNLDEGRGKWEGGKGRQKTEDGRRENKSKQAERCSSKAEVGGGVSV